MLLLIPCMKCQIQDGVLDGFALVSYSNSRRYIDWGPGYRIYLAKDGEHLVILLGGGTKRRQQVDIKRAKALWVEYKARKATVSRSRETR